MFMSFLDDLKENSFFSIKRENNKCASTSYKYRIVFIVLVWYVPFDPLPVKTPSLGRTCNYSPSQALRGQ